MSDAHWGADDRSVRQLAHAPAIQALLIQVISFAFVLLVERSFVFLNGPQLTVAAAALLQGVAAAAISRWRKLAPWWLPIQAIFPIALAALLAVQLPSWLFLAAFIFLLGLYWSTFRTQVPFYPSRRAAWEAVASVLPAGRRVCFVDVGSGLGGLVIHLAGRRPDSSFSGIEVAPLPWLVSVLRGCVRRSRARFVRGDYDRLAFAAYDVVFAYLSPAAMPSLWRKVKTEMRPGTLLLSYEFPIPGIEPDLVLSSDHGGPPLYGWYMPPAANLA